MPKKAALPAVRKQATQIRIDEGLFDYIKAIAVMEKRTFNSQVEYFLEKAVSDFSANNPRVEFYLNEEPDE